MKMTFNQLFSWSPQILSCIMKTSNKVATWISIAVFASKDSNAGGCRAEGLDLGFMRHILQRQKPWSPAAEARSCVVFTCLQAPSHILLFFAPMSLAKSVNFDLFIREKKSLWRSLQLAHMVSRATPSVQGAVENHANGSSHAALGRARERR